MGYECVVLAKQVPDTKAVTGKAMNDDGTVNRGALPAIFNPEDLNALELALQIKEQHGGTVTILSMGPPSACELLRAALERHGFWVRRVDHWEPPPGPFFGEEMRWHNVWLKVLDAVRFLRPLSRFAPLNRFFSNHIWVLAERQ